MTSAAFSATIIQVEHAKIQSRKSFESVKMGLKSLIPQIDAGIFLLLSNGETERARDALEKGPTLAIFGSHDHGALLAIYGLRQRAIQYHIGNPLTASKMTRHQLSAALYAPIRVLLRESASGDAAFEYDRPQSVFGQFNDPGVNAVAEKLDRDLQDVLQKAAG